MKKVNFSYLTLLIATGALLFLISSVIVSVVTHSLSINLLLGISIILVIITIPGIILVIIETAREKPVNKSTVTTATKDITTRFILREGPVTIDAPDAESAVKAWQEIHENLLKGESHLKAESQLTVEVKEPEELDVPETKEEEE
jgi:c-di-AMP phosphodiesterase-like protein